MSEEEIKKLVADETAKQLTEYYRRSYPHFEISSGVESEAHGPTEYCMTTDTYQGIHFYKQGNMKVRSNKSVEIYSCLLYTYQSPRDLTTSRMPTSA